MTKKPNKTVAQLPARTGILVLGMHRSGTSALTGMLHYLGCDLPAHLLPPNVGNDLGHWESEAVMVVNDQMLESAGSCWIDWVGINPDWYQSAHYEHFLQRARATLRAEFADSPLFVLKDPRICRLAPLWLEAMHFENIAARIILPLRNPLEVSVSLQMRDGIESAYGQLLWLRHVLDAEYFSRGRPRMFCTYNQLLNQRPRLIKRTKTALGISWPRTTDANRDAIAEFLSEKKRHHVETEEVVLANSALSHWLRDSYGTLLRWCEGNEKAEDYAVLDSIRREFDAASSAFSPLSGPKKQANIAGGGPDQVQLQQELATALSRADAAEATIRDFQIQAEEAQNRENELTRRLEQSSQEIARILPELEASKAASAGAFQRFAANETALRENIDALNGEIATLAAALETSRAETSELNYRLATMASTLQQRLEEIEQTRQDLDSVLQRAQASTDEWDRLNHRLAEADSWIFRLAGERRTAEMESAAAKRELAAAQRAAQSAEQARNAALDKLKEAEARLKGAKTVRQDVVAKEDTFPQADVAREAEKASSDDISGREENEAELQRLADEVDAQRKISEKLSRELNESNEAKSSAIMALDERFREISTMTRLLRQSEAARGQNSSQLEWLQQVNAVLMSSPRWWSLMPPQWSRRKELLRLKMRGLFDAEHYLELHPDVRAEGMDPLRHYILHGMAEGRSR